MMARLPREVAGFHVLPVVLQSTVAFPHDVQHHVYIKQHESVTDEDAFRSLFLVNIPVSTTEVHLRHLFHAQLGGGLVERVHFPNTLPHNSAAGEEQHKRPSKKRKRMTADELEMDLRSHSLPGTRAPELHSSGAHAIVVFVDRPSMETTLRAAKKAIKLHTAVVWGRGIEDKVEPLGMQKYAKMLKTQYPPRSDLMHVVDDYMGAYNQMMEARSRENTRRRQMPDEDGFVTVTKGIRGGVKQKEAETPSERQKQKTVGLDDFYRFQMRDRRKDQQGEMLRMFEEDKRKIEEMKKQRGRFRPEH